MKTIKAFAVASLVSAGAAIAAADLWNFPTLLAATNEPFWGQVHVPGAIFCWDDADEPTGANNYFSPCYGQTGGWWWGYADNDGKVVDGVATNYDLAANGALQIEEWSADAEKHVFIRNKGLGDATEGLHVKFVLAAGTAEEPSLAGIGFNWRNKDGNDYEGNSTEDISGETGLCLEYWASKAGVTVELGWNEKAYGYNTWVYTLPACLGFCKADMPWSSFEQSYEGDTEERVFALRNAESLKFAYKNKAAATDIDFKIRAVGWNGTCSGSDPVPITGKIAATPKFNLSGRVLSVANISSSAQVQVINMQGAVVAQKVLEPNQSLNLANIPTGVYLVRSAKIGRAHV